MALSLHKTQGGEPEDLQLPAVVVELKVLAEILNPFNLDVGDLGENVEVEDGFIEPGITGGFRALQGHWSFRKGLPKSLDQGIEWLVSAILEQVLGCCCVGGLANVLICDRMRCFDFLGVRILNRDKLCVD